MFTSALKSLTSNITANYTIASTPTCVTGAWKVYDGKKKSTGKAVSVFVFERKSLDSRSGGLGGRSGTASLRKLHDEVIERLKKEASSLARLRHPSILELTEPVEDTRNGGLMFATEPVTASLAGLLQEKDDQEKAGGIGGRPSRYVTEDTDGRKRRKELEIDELEIQKGLLQVAKGLEFLHESAGLVHGNLNPEAICVNLKGDWKLSGLGFAGPPDTSIGQGLSPPLSLSEALYHDPRLPKSVQLNLDYTSPDFVIDSNVSAAADMFSLGIVILALYNSPHTSPLETNANLSAYKRLFSTPSLAPSSGNNYLISRPLPKDVVTTVLPRLFIRRPAQRMNARDFQQSQFFDNILVSTIQFLDSLPAKTQNEKSQFLKGLLRILEQFPKSVLDKKVLSALLDEVKDRDLLSLILQDSFKIVQILGPSGRRACSDRVVPRLRDIFLSASAKGGPTDRDSAKEAGLAVVLDHINLLAENCSKKEFKDDILPIVQLSIESSIHSLVDKALGCLPVMLGVLDFSTIKHEVFPVVAAVFGKTNSLGIKIRGLQAFVILCGGLPNSVEGNMSEKIGEDIGRTQGSQSPAPAKRSSNAILDKWTVQEKIVPLLKAIKTKEPAVMMAALAVFRQVGSIADPEFVAMDVLPILWNFSLGPLLNLAQFQEFMHLVKQLSKKVEQEQTKKLQGFASTSASSFEQPRSNDLMDTGPYHNGSMEVGEDDFEALVLGRNSSNRINTSNRNLENQFRVLQPTKTETPVFSWSTPANVSSSQSNNMAPQHTSDARTITPDQTLHGFAPLKPSFPSESRSVMQTLTPMQPISSAYNGISNAPRQNSPSRTTFSIPPPLTIDKSFQKTQSTQLTATSAFSAPNHFPGPQQQHAEVAGALSGLGRLPAPQAQAPNTRSGLDAYQSLL